jgi:hypothetical protein
LTIKDHANYNVEVTTDSGATYRIFANWLHNEKQDFWQGWHCEAGATRLYIDHELNVFGGMCQNDSLGSALDPNFKPLDLTVCRQPRCNGCTDDLQTSKHHPDYLKNAQQ